MEKSGIPELLHHWNQHHQQLKPAQAPLFLHGDDIFCIICSYLVEFEYLFASSRARYLKNKYGPRNKESNSNNDESGNQQPANMAAGNRSQQQRFSRSRSIGTSSTSPTNSNNNNGRWTSEENGNNSKEPPSNNLITSPSRHQYMQKRKVVMKFGTRGSEPGLFTWPRGVAVGPDNSIVVADSSNHRVQVRLKIGY